MRGDAGALGRARPAITPEVVQGAAVVIDALFGAGLSRPLAGAEAEAVEIINAARAAGAAILSVDVPSGLDGSTGEARGPVVTATQTVTFFRLKPATF